MYALHCTALHFTALCMYVLQVSRWTKSVDLFVMDLVLVPINLDSHWSLVVILRPGLLLVSKQHTHTVFAMFLYQSFFD